jgi:hypothetical protein
MKISKNVQGKKYICFFIITSLIFCLILIIQTHIQNAKQTEIINNKISQIVGEVEKQYPRDR